MRAQAPRDGGRWCDVQGSLTALFCQVEQVAEDPEPTTLPSRLHQQGQVVGRSLDSLYVCLRGRQVISLPPHLLRVLDDVVDGQ